MSPPIAPRISTGVPGLDDILGGGLPPHRLYLVEGDPGVGKTTLALAFLRDGAARGEKCLYVTLSETAEELTAVAASHGWDLRGIEMHELSPDDEDVRTDTNTLFHPSEVELAETTKSILGRVDAVKPSRVVFDSLSEMRLLAQHALRYRRQILALKQFFVGRKCTVLLMDDKTAEGHDPQLQSIVHGVIELESTAPMYGVDRRRLLVRKMRGVAFRGGYHDYRIRTGGIEVTPRLVAAEHRNPTSEGIVASGVPALDALLGGGLDRGTSALLTGPAGSGKSVIASRYAYAAAERGETVAVFCFDEAPSTLRVRAAALGMPLDKHIDEGRIRVHQIDPAELTPGEFSALVRRELENGAKLLVIDSLNGYMHAMPEAQYLTAQMHELLAYAGQVGALTIMIMAQHGLGASMQSPADVSYLADTVLMFRFFEAGGEVRKAISVLKRRRGPHERTIRELELGGARGILVGRPLTAFRGVLSGVPQRVGPEPDE